MLDIVLHAVSRGVDYRNGKIYGVSGKELAPRSGGKGYRVVGLPKPTGGFTNIYVHKLVYWFETRDVRVFDKEFEIHHKDKDRSNNNFGNLELLPAREHEGISSKLNLHNARITREIAKEIIVEYKAGGISQKNLGEKYGLSQQHICDIVNGRKWGAKWD